MTTPHRHATGVVRREFLQVGFSGFLGMSLAGVLQRQALAAVAPRAKSMIIVFCTGAPSHIDTFDPKPDAPDGIRGEFKPIATNVPGISFSEHLPHLAARADKLAVVRTMSHSNLNHLNSTHLVLTGQAQPGAFFDKIASRDDYPCYSSVVDTFRPSPLGLPGGVNLPTFLMEGPLVWPGQHAGFLGATHDPWQIKSDPSQPGFRVNELTFPEGLTVERLGRRRDLLGDLSRAREAIEGFGEVDTQRKVALSLLLSGTIGRAFQLEKEDPKTRDRYGRHMFGQSLLLARRLVEAGVPVVQANMGRVQNWDTHQNNFTRLKNELLPPLDQGVSALLDDLATTGKLDETLVMITGEFGRSPRIGAERGADQSGTGRNHWGSCFSTVFAGAGIRGGQTIGTSDKIGGYPATRPFSPADLGATVYRALGIDVETTVLDRLKRPVRLCTGYEIEALYSGAVA